MKIPPWLLRRVVGIFLLGLFLAKATIPRSLRPGLVVILDGVKTKNWRRALKGALMVVSANMSEGVFIGILLLMSATVSTPY